MQTRVDCECENPKTRRHTEHTGEFKTKTACPSIEAHEGMSVSANKEYDLLECLGCGEVEPVLAATEICTLTMHQHYDSDCSPTSYQVLMRKGNEYYVLSKTSGEMGTRVNSREPISTKEADALIAEYAPTPTECRDCGRELEGRRDYHIPYLCHVCAGIRVEATC